MKLLRKTIARNQSRPTTTSRFSQFTRPGGEGVKVPGPRTILFCHLAYWGPRALHVKPLGNDKIILCERGIRTFETATRNTLDIVAIPVLHGLTHLPVIVDPSHSTGFSRLVSSMSMASVSAGADGLIIEVHNDPMHALCDGAQSLSCEQFDELFKKIKMLVPIADKKFN